MKRTLVFIIILVCQVVTGQIKNGSVQYCYISNINTNDAQNPEFSEQIAKIKESTKTVTFTLNFNQNASYFFVNPILGKDAKSMQEVCMSAAVESKFFTSPNSSEYRCFRDDESFGEYVMEYKQETEWTLTTETKMIGEYLCYKATTPAYNEDGWTANPNLNTIAWYTPKIPVSFGPNGYGELPGLILELQRPMSTLYVKKIDLNLEKAPEIKNLKEFKVIAYNQILEKILNSTSGFQREFLEKEFKKNAIIREEQDAIHKKRKEEKAKLLKQ